MKSYLSALATSPVNFSEAPERMTAENGWIIDSSEGRVGIEPPGPVLPEGIFERAKLGLMHYDFSDPQIVTAHFDPATPFMGRNLLLEIKILGFHFLCGCRVFGIREETLPDRTIWGFRYDTLQGHVECGFEWFLLTKYHDTGEVRFRIDAHWKAGSLPYWWMRVGFRLLAGYYRTLWRQRGPERLYRLAHRHVQTPLPPRGQLAHRGDPSPQLSEKHRLET